MTNITSSPQNYSPAFSALIYEIECESSDNFEVEIYDATTDELLGTKRYSDLDTHQVYISDYVQYQFDIQPLISSPCALQVDEDKLKGVYVKVDEQDATDATWHTFAVESVDQNQMMTNAPTKRKIAWAECDEFSFIATECSITARYFLLGEQGYYQILNTSIDADNQVVSLLTDMSVIAQELESEGFETSDFYQMILSVEVDDDVAFSVEYELTSVNYEHKRLCWINKYGAVDYYTFEGRSNSQFEVSKTRIYSADGYKVTNSEANTTMLLYSDFEPLDTMAWLSEMLASPKIWLVEKDGEYSNIDITTQSVVYDSDDLLRLEINVRNTLNQTFQHN